MTVTYQVTVAYFSLARELGRPVAPSDDELLGLLAAAGGLAPARVVQEELHRGEASGLQWCSVCVNLGAPENSP